MNNPMPLLADHQIATHEAGHALVGHLMGDRIGIVKMYTGLQSASVVPVEWPPSRAMVMAGNAAEILFGMTVYPERAEHDLSVAAGLPVDAGNPSPRRMLIAHMEAFEDLRAWFSEARVERRELDGSKVHEFLEARRCAFRGGESGSASKAP